MSSESYPEGSINFNYDGFLRRQSMTDVSGTTTYNYDARDRMTAKNNATYGNLAYTYDYHGNLTSLTSGNTYGASVTYQYDALNRPVTATDQHRSLNLTTAYSYDAIGNLNNMALPNGVAVTYAYDSLNRLTNMQSLLTSNSSPVASYAYTLGSAGNRLNVAELSGRSVTWTYDDLYRLISETVTSPKQGDPTGGVTYTYDPVGNRQTRNSTLPGIGNQNPAYDSSGNDWMTSDGASPSASFSYDAQRLSDPSWAFRVSDGLYL